MLRRSESHAVKYGEVERRDHGDGSLSVGWNFDCAIIRKMEQVFRRRCPVWARGNISVDRWSPGGAETEV